MSADQEAGGRPGYHHGDLRRALIAAGRELIREGGQDGLTIRAAASRAQVTVAAPYRHFADKQALIAAIRAQALHELADHLELTAAADPLAHLHALGHAFVAMAAAEPALFRLLTAPAASTVDDQPAEVVAAQDRLAGIFRGAVGSAVAAGAIDGNVETIMLTLRSTLYGLAGMIIDGGLDTDAARDAADAVMATVDTGLLPRPGT